MRVFCHPHMGSIASCYRGTRLGAPCRVFTAAAVFRCSSISSLVDKTSSSTRASPMLSLVLLLMATAVECAHLPVPNSIQSKFMDFETIQFMHFGISSTHFITIFERVKIFLVYTILGDEYDVYARIYGSIDIVLQAVTHVDSSHSCHGQFSPSLTNSFGPVAL